METDIVEPERISAEELMRRLEAGEEFLILDARSKQSYRLSPVRIKGAVRVPPREVETRFQELPIAKPILVYCSEAGEEMSRRVARALIEQGLGDVRVLRGGIEAWLRAGYPVEPKED